MKTLFYIGFLIQEDIEWKEKMIFNIQRNLYLESKINIYYFFSTGSYRIKIFAPKRFLSWFAPKTGKSHPKKAPSPIDTRFFDGGIMIALSELQQEKAQCPIDFTDAGIMIWPSEVQLEIALFPINSTDVGIMSSVSEVQLEKA